MRFGFRVSVYAFGFGEPRTVRGFAHRPCVSGVGFKFRRSGLGGLSNYLGLLTAWGLGFGFGFRIEDLGSRVWGLGFRVQALGCRF